LVTIPSPTVLFIYLFLIRVNSKTIKQQSIQHNATTKRKYNNEDGKNNGNDM